MQEVINRIIKELENEKYAKDGGELFTNGSNEDCIPVRRVYEIVNNAMKHDMPFNSKYGSHFMKKFVEVR